MGRLIDADELMELYDGLEDRGFVIPVDAVIQNIKDMPTAYDIGKVVKQLEDDAMKWESVHSQGGFIDLDKAIEIVKSGGIE